MVRRAVLLSIVAEVVVVVAVFAYHGAGPAGAEVAARATARMSALIFSLALAWRSREGGPALMRGFVAAHAVHYGAVTYLASVATQHHLHHLTVRSGTVVVFGVGLLIILWTTTVRQAWFLRWAGAVAVYLAWTIFVGGALLNGLGLREPQHWPALLPLLTLLPAMGYHLRALVKQRRAGTLRAHA